MLELRHAILALHQSLLVFVISIKVLLRQLHSFVRWALFYTGTGYVHTCKTSQRYFVVAIKSNVCASWNLILDKLIRQNGYRQGLCIRLLTAEDQQLVQSTYCSTTHQVLFVLACMTMQNSASFWM